MKRGDLRIDFELLKKKLTNTISSEEEIIFQLWLEQDSGNRDFLKKAQNYIKNGSSFQSNPIGAQRAWKKIEYKLYERQKQRRKVRILTIYSSIAASAALIVILLVFNSLRDQSYPSIVSDSIIKPGTEKATLIMDNGETIELDTNKVILLEDKTKLIVKDNTINYTELNGKSNVVKFNTLNVKKAETYSIILSDGTKVYLNSETTLRFPVQFTEKERKVELTGEAFFDVTYNKDVPFRVISNNQVIEVLGTSFNVNAYPDEEIITTTLVQGKVKVYDLTHPEMEGLLIPNQQAILRKLDGQIITHEVNVLNFISWKDGFFFFQDMRLEDMMTILQRWYDVEVVYNNEKTKELHFGGKLKRFENLNKLLSLIEKTGEVQFEIKDKQIIVK